MDSYGPIGFHVHLWGNPAIMDPATPPKLEKPCRRNIIEEADSLMQDWDNMVEAAQIAKIYEPPPNAKTPPRRSGHG